ncbi:MAG: hypothetical protein ABIX01_06900 [Chitinophagaceae bacterium]
MKAIIEAEEKKSNIVHIDNSLDRYSNISLFPKKVTKAKKMLATNGLPGERTLSKK